MRFKEINWGEVYAWNGDAASNIFSVLMTFLVAALAIVLIATVVIYILGYVGSYDKRVRKFGWAMLAILVPTLMLALPEFFFGPVLDVESGVEFIDFYVLGGGKLLLGLAPAALALFFFLDRRKPEPTATKLTGRRERRHKRKERNFTFLMASLIFGGGFLGYTMEISGLTALLLMGTAVCCFFFWDEYKIGALLSFLFLVVLDILWLGQVIFIGRANGYGTTFALAGGTYVLFTWVRNGKRFDIMNGIVLPMSLLVLWVQAHPIMSLWDWVGTLLM